MVCYKTSDAITVAFLKPLSLCLYCRYRENSTIYTFLIREQGFLKCLPLEVRYNILKCKSLVKKLIMNNNTVTVQDGKDFLKTLYKFYCNMYSYKPRYKCWSTPPKKMNVSSWKYCMLSYSTKKNLAKNKGFHSKWVQKTVIS